MDAELGFVAAAADARAALFYLPTTLVVHVEQSISCVCVFACVSKQ